MNHFSDSILETMRITNIPRNARGFSVAQTLIGGTLLIGVAFGVMELVTSTMRTARQGSLRHTREQMIVYLPTSSAIPQRKASPSRAPKRKTSSSRVTPLGPLRNWPAHGSLRTISIH